MAVLSLVLIGWVSLGHVALWTSLYNKFHASGLRRRWVRIAEKAVVLAVAVAGLGLVYEWTRLAVRLADGMPRTGADLWLLGYSACCCGVLGWKVLSWARSRRRVPSAGRLLANQTERVDIARQLGRLPIHRPSTLLAARIPGNEIMDVHFQHKVLQVARLPECLEGLRIAQLSDLHMSGQLQRSFFEQVVARANQWEPHLVALTGDLLESLTCLNWIPNTLGRLRSRDGVFFVLGNHDRRLSDPGALRRALSAQGLRDVGGRWLFHEMGSARVLLAGNECPWFPPAPELPDLAPGPSGLPDQRPFSVLLAHTPDQLPWARSRGFDLMLAGHTHGGQIRLPGIGAIVCPSRFGVRYACGVFSEEPTLLHVTRGLSGVQPLRFGCPPEVTLLELRRVRQSP